jgi:hypothetical protein
MTREDIIRMAREAGFPDYAMGLASEDAWQKTERFAALVAEAEREACAKICDGEATLYYSAQRCATKIRARGCQK